MWSYKIHGAFISPPPSPHTHTYINTYTVSVSLTVTITRHDKWRVLWPQRGVQEPDAKGSAVKPTRFWWLPLLKGQFTSKQSGLCNSCRTVVVRVIPSRGHRAQLVLLNLCDIMNMSNNKERWCLQNKKYKCKLFKSLEMIDKTWLKAQLYGTLWNHDSNNYYLYCSQDESGLWLQLQPVGQEFILCYHMAV